MKSPIRIKICGIVHSADAQNAVAAGADALGFNFYPRSLRSIAPADAAAIIQELPATVCSVGVFVNSPVSEIVAVAQQCRLHAIQFHGDETPEWCRQLRDRVVLRAIRLSPETTLEAALEEIDQWASQGVAAVLLDAAVGDRQYGGSGQTIDWELARDIRQSAALPIILAGGLNPENVGAAIERVCPAGVDVASGVESFPGKKSPELVQAFISRALDTYSQIVQ